MMYTLYMQLMMMLLLVVMVVSFDATRSWPGLELFLEWRPHLQPVPGL